MPEPDPVSARSSWSMTHAQYDLPRPPNFRSGCEGKFVVEEDTGKGPVVVICDVCRLRVGVTRKVFNAGPPAPATEQIGIDTGEAF